MKAIEVLQNARETLSDNMNWTKGGLFGKRVGLAARPQGWVAANAVENLEKADCFCSIGAVAKACDVRLTLFISDLGILYTDIIANTPGAKVSKGQQRAFEAASKYLNAAARVISGKNYMVAFLFNDRSTTDHAKVLQMFDLAIKFAKRRHLPKPEKAVAK